jgi:hypothetical protein
MTNRQDDESGRAEVGMDAVSAFNCIKASYSLNSNQTKP